MIDPSASVHLSAIVEQGAHVGARSRIWHFVHVLGGARIGADCSLGQGCYVAATVVVGDRVKVQNNVSLYDGVLLEDDVFVGPSVVFTNVKNPRARVDRRHQFRGTTVRRGATLGANSTVVCGVELGEYCFVGAGAVVSRDIAPYVLAVGVPARPVGWMSRNGERLVFDGQGVAVCPGTGERYRRAADGSVWFDGPTRDER